MLLEVANSYLRLQNFLFEIFVLCKTKCIFTLQVVGTRKP
jgi:hypothetical protein